MSELLKNTQELDGKVSLCDLVEQSLQTYFDNLNGQIPTALYAMVTAEVERPLLKIVMDYTGGNQSQAAQVLGINRNTLHGKLNRYNLL